MSKFADQVQAAEPITPRCVDQDGWPRPNKGPQGHYKSSMSEVQVHGTLSYTQNMVNNHLRLYYRYPTEEIQAVCVFEIVKPLHCTHLACHGIRSPKSCLQTLFKPKLTHKPPLEGALD